MTNTLKICKKCRYCDIQERMNVCYVCGGEEMIFWDSECPDLLKNFITKYDNLYSNNLKSRIQLIEETDFKSEHPGHKIDRVLSRLKLIELLHTDDTYGQFIEAGFNQETSLRLYLLCTCFDILGQNNNFIDFKSWLKAKKGQKGQKIKLERQQAISSINLEELNSEEELIEVITLVHDKWTQSYGMNKSFYNFFYKYLDIEDRLLMTSKVWIGNNPYAPNITSVYLLDMPEEWLMSDEQTKVKKIVDALSRLIRNNYTHQGIRIVDRADKDHINPEVRKIEAILLHNPEIKKCVFREEFDSFGINYAIGISSTTIGTDGEQVLAYSESEYDVQELKNDFLGYTQMQLTIGGDIYFPDAKKALCYRNCSLTKLLYRLAEKGLYNYILSVSNPLL